MAVGLVALRVRLDIAALAQVLVHELALARGHGIQRHGPPPGDGGLSRLIGLAAQRRRAAIAVAGGVDDHAYVGRAAAERNPLGEVLHGLDRLPVPPDEQPELLPDQRPGDGLAVLADL